MLMKNLLDQPFVHWMSSGAQDGDIVLASRIRLARNLEGIPFPQRANGEQLSQVVSQLKSSLCDLNSNEQSDYMFIDLEKLPLLERLVLVEKHIISPDHAREASNRAILVKQDTTVSIMVNEEDHLRIQCLMPGLNLVKAFTSANQVDDIIENKHALAFNEELGYLTSCPTNLGTGLRASVMVHLPALVLTGQINRIVNAVIQLGLTVRGLYGEGTEAVGNIFQISNQLTLGFTEQEIIDNLYSVVKQVVDHERTARGGLYADTTDMLVDRVWRAYGTLKYARSISGQEALALLSDVRMGYELGIINEGSNCNFNELMVITRPNFLQKMSDRPELSGNERKKLRAQIIREKLTND
ncbi:protein arginine kinase [Pelosinus fermentans]|uniref:Protein-arginine kinase n=1 Tax=Pelosinus fermentans JBW45 TaxID=1192197 RepID=I9DFV9_9FIRM|nr:protein arginine kinase [Pelosinus fermentans]AJQ29259.1 protein arginine kinase, McsB [Pelosinus fermentans JBW45]